MASLRKRGRVWYYRFTDEFGIKREEKGCTDRQATQELARDSESRVARIKAGLIDPKAERIQTDGRRSIGEHVDDFIASLRMAGRNSQHIAQTERYVRQVLTLARIDRLSELTPSRVVAALADFKANGITGPKAKNRDKARTASTRTVESRVVAIKAFSRWAWRDGRTADYDLKALAKPRDPSDRRRIRRVLSDTELQILIEQTRKAPTWRGVSAPDRSMLYVVAALTGFRRRELRSLTRESFLIDEQPARIVCDAGYAKNGKLADQPIPETLAAALRPWLAGKPPRVPVFGNLPQRTGLMLAIDLQRCGIAPVDESGRVVDLHSLRHGYITSLAKAGTPIKTLQTLARHSDPRLTLNTYTHATLFDTGKAVESLPDPFHPAPTIQPHALAATGTEASLAHRQPYKADGPTIETPENSGPGSPPISEPFAHLLLTAGDGNGRLESDAGGTTDSVLSIEAGRKSLKGTGVAANSRVESGTVGRVADGIRTRDIQIHNLVP